MTESDRADLFGAAGAPRQDPCPARMPPSWNSSAAKPHSCATSWGRQRVAAAARLRDIHQLEARIEQLASRNAKLMDTLKEARQQLLALREEVDRLGQPPSGYGVLLLAHEDDTVDVFTSGRKMRLTCSPNIDVSTLKQGQTVRLNEALTWSRPAISRRSARSARCARSSRTASARW